MDKRKHGCMGIINFLLESRLGEKVSGHNIGKENWFYVWETHGMYSTMLDQPH